MTLAEMIGKNIASPFLPQGLPVALAARQCGYPDSDVGRYQSILAMNKHDHFMVGGWANSATIGFGGTESYRPMEALAFPSGVQGSV